MGKYTVFVSHSHLNRDFAIALKDLIEDAFVGTLDVFVSSDPRSIPPGVRWEEELWSKLETASIYIVVLSPLAISKPWVIFEAGAACGRKVRLIPICICGLNPDDVGSPLNKYQLLSIESSLDVCNLVRQIADHHHCWSKADNNMISKVADLAKPRSDDLPPPLSNAAKQSEPVLIEDMRSGIDEIMAGRKVFWETLDQVYAGKYKGRRGYPETIGALAELADTPRGLPVEPGENLRDYPTKHARFLLDHAAQLYDFCKAVYPFKVADKTLGDCSSVTDGQFEAFHSARGLHSKFWNRWAQKIYQQRALSLDAIVQEFDAQRHMVNLLSYLETSLVQWTQDIGPGKTWLFRLNRDWDRIRALASSRYGL